MRSHGRCSPEQMAAEMTLPSSRQLGLCSGMRDDNPFISRLEDVLSSLLFMKRSSWEVFCCCFFGFLFLFYFKRQTNMVTGFYSPLGKMNVLDVVIHSIQTFLCASGEKLRKSLSSGS